MSDPEHLYRTLVQEGLVPRGFSDAFDNFYKVVDTAAQRTYRKLSKIDNVSSAVSLHKAQKQQNESPRSITPASVFQPIPPAAPLLFKSRLERARCTGPTARSDAEAVERGRWIDSLEKMLRFSPTPMGRLLSTVPGSKDLLGGGRRLSTLRVRGIRKFLTFVSSTFGVDFPSSVEHYTSFLQMRVSEPCTRCALKQSHMCIAFMEEVAGVQKSDRFTHTQLYEIIYSELLTSALPAQAVKQAPRLFVSIIMALEKYVADTAQPAYLRVYAWKLNLQCWCTLRFSDHRGIKPAMVRVKGGSLSASLSWSKTLGHDKPVRARPLVVDPCCFFAEPLWMSTGWQLLSAMAPFARDFLLPAPSAALTSCLRTELRYEVAYSLQGRLLSLLTDRNGFHLTRVAPQFWTPHSPRNFLPSAAAALGFTKADRDFLGGWSARGSDAYARTAQHKILNIQRAVLREFHSLLQPDPLGEAESLDQLEQYLVNRKAQPTVIAQALVHLMDVQGLAPAAPAASTAPLVPDFDTALQADPPLDDQQVEEKDDVPNSKRKRSDSPRARRRAAALGDDPREQRRILRAGLDPGFYIAVSAKKGRRTLHKLGSCFMVPGIDYFRYSYVGPTQPASSRYDAICKSCTTLTKLQGRADSDESNSSSSTDEAL